MNLFLTFEKLLPAAAAVVVQKQFEENAGQIPKSWFFSEFIIQKKIAYCNAEILKRRVCSDFIPSKKKKDLLLGRNFQKSVIHIVFSVDIVQSVEL